MSPTSSRRPASCRCTCSWSDTRRRRCTGPIRVSTDLASATALTTLASFFIQTPGPDVAVVPPLSPLRPPCRWTPPTILPSSSVQSMNKCPPHPAEALDLHDGSVLTLLGVSFLFFFCSAVVLAYNCQMIRYHPSWSPHFGCL